MAKKLTIEEVRQYVHENSDCELLSTEYIDSREKLEFMCNCGDVFSVNYNGFKSERKRQCNNCGYRNRVIIQNTRAMTRFTNLIAEEGYVQLSEYKTSQQHVLVMCENGHKYQVTPNSFMSGYRCAECYGNERKTTTQFSHDLATVHKGEYKLRSEYTNNRAKVRVFCKSCEGFWYAKPNGLLSGQGCPNCKKSKGEYSIYVFLDNFKLPFVSEYRFYDCRNTRPLPFDFAVFSDESQEKPEFLIEYDGIQHFEPRKVFGGQEQFEKQQLHDKIKDEYCKQNGIELIRIPYWEQDNIEEILSERLGSLIE